MVELVEEDGSFEEQPLRSSEARVRLLQLEGDLFFGVADALGEALGAVREAGARAVVLRLKRTHSVDSTVLLELERFVLEMKSLGRHVLLCGVRPELADRMRAFGLVDLIGENALFETERGIFASASAALVRARGLAEPDSTAPE